MHAGWIEYNERVNASIGGRLQPFVSGKARQY